MSTKNKQMINNLQNQFIFKSSSEEIVYEDTEEHFNNGVLRLLNIDEETFKKWAELSGEQNYTLLENLRIGFDYIVRKSVDAGPNGEQGYLWIHSIAENNLYGIVKSIDGSVAWLVKNELSCIKRVTEPPAYEENYFEGNKKEAGGYGDYIEQSDWRLEKANRQLNEYFENTITFPITRKALDVGSGYGYFRKALEQQGYIHDGIEVSKHAIQITKDLYGYDTFHGTLDQYSDQLKEQYDLVTMWDVIEHVSDPITLLKDAVKCLKPGGFLIIKTPNINCPEVNIFYNYYHSFKREHLVYFTKESLSKYASLAGLSAYLITSKSHLLTGFVGKEKTDRWEVECKGTDLVAYFIKKIII